MRTHCHWQQETLQVFATDMNVKKTDSLVTRNITGLYCWLNLSQLCRKAAVKAAMASVAGDLCSHRNSIAGNTGSYVAGSSVAYEDYTADLNKFK